MAVDGKDENTRMYGPWLLVENQYHQKFKDSPKLKSDLMVNKKEGSRFRALTDLEGTVASVSNPKINGYDNQKNKRKEILLVEDSGAPTGNIKGG